MYERSRLRMGSAFKSHDNIAQSLRYKSFCLGIFITSLTWIVALYLYYNLAKNDIGHYPTPRGHLSSYLSDKVETKRKQNVFPITKHSSENILNKDYIYKNQKTFRYNEIIDSADKNRVRKKEKLHRMDNEVFHIDGSEAQTEAFDLALIRYPEDLKIREDGYRQHAFNLLVSDRLGYHRSLPDTRNPLCQAQVYDSDLPAVSIIICFYNEARSALLRTVHSVLDCTADYLIHEILLVDDNSELGDLKEDFKIHIETHFTSKVKLLRTPKREGLIRARMFGARQATGEVLMFLDSHCEVNEQWLEPLLTRIIANRTTVVCPIIDIINADTLAYSASPIVRGGFNWGLHFKWDGLPPNSLVTKEDFIKPIRSPTMAGGLFAIDRKFFFQLGEYDDGMDIWGGENLEMSFRVWMCGGSLEIIPCARIGHIFRRRRPYGSPTGQDTLLFNSLRVAHVWMDEYKENFFVIRPDARSLAYGNITGRLKLRKDLKCHSFDWYLKNIYPELKAPTPRHGKEKSANLKERQLQKLSGLKPKKRYTQNFVASFHIRLHGSNLCIESEKEITAKGSALVLRNCHITKSQMWFETDKQELLLAELLCLDAGEEAPRLSKCHEMGGTQEWRHKAKNKTKFYNMATGMCLGTTLLQENSDVIMEICTQPRSASWDLLDLNSLQDTNF